MTMNTNTENDKHRVDGMKIGEYVQKAIKNLFNQNKIYESDLIKLQKQDFCKIKFDLNYPMLKKKCAGLCPWYRLFIWRTV